MRLKSWLTILVCALGLTGLALSVACGGDDSSSSTTTTTTTTGAATGTSGGASGAALPSLAVTATEYTYAAPASVPSGFTDIKLTNSGKEPHQAQIVRINDGVTDAQFQASLQDPTGLDLLKATTVMGGPNVILPGVTADTIGDLKPGKYAFLCFVSGDDNIPHVAKGMVKAFDVTQGTSTATAPTASQQMQQVDYAFLAPDTLPAGKTTVQVTNQGKEAHEVTILQLNGGITPQQLAQLFSDPNAAPPPGPSPITESGGLGAIAPGATGYGVFDLKPGSYVFVCFLPDANGTPHVAKGMLRSFTVK